MLSFSFYISAGRWVRHLVSDADDTLQTYQGRFKDIKERIRGKLDVYNAVWAKESRSGGEGATHGD